MHVVLRLCHCNSFLLLIYTFSTCSMLIRKFLCTFLCICARCSAFVSLQLVFTADLHVFYLLYAYSKVSLHVLMHLCTLFCVCVTAIRFFFAFVRFFHLSMSLRFSPTSPRAFHRSCFYSALYPRMLKYFLLISTFLFVFLCFSLFVSFFLRINTFFFLLRVLCALEGFCVFE